MASTALINERINETSPETVEELLDRIRLYHPDANLELIKKAYDYSDKAHSGQFRRSGEPYISHPLGVAGILSDLKMDEASIITGLLHDTVEDTEVSLEDIEKEFGPVVRELVDGVTKLSQMRFRHTHEKQGENIRKMIVAMGKDVRVILVKLADRLHNMRSLNHLPYDKQKRIAQETLDIYSPLAGRLGIMGLKVELEDLSFRFSEPDQFYSLVQRVSKRRAEREHYINEVKDVLVREIKTRTQVDFEVFGRPKHLFSIHKKMKIRDVDYDQIFDLLAFRVVVQSVPECYEVLGIVHSLWKPIPGRFKDFIAMPKTNNYQSLHTTVIGPGGERIEIQIRTEEMHLIAEWGIAAHWKYKEESQGKKNLEQFSIDRYGFLRELITMHQTTKSADEFLENIKTDLVDSEIYVFTPKGDVKELPDGATPIDFAYAVHTDIGHRIVAARVNGRIVTLRHRLRNGDTIEVITSKTQTPSKDWLKYSVTSRAKSKIRAFVQGEQRKRAQGVGSEMVERAFRKEGLPIQKTLQGPEFDNLLKDNGCATVDDLYIRVGYGKVNPADIIAALAPQKVSEETQPSFLQKVIRSAVNRNKKVSKNLITVDGMDDVLVRYAKCCVPIPGDPIVGFISRGRGITIHRADCEKAFEIDQTRQIDVGWTDNADSNTSGGRMVRVRIISEDKSGLLKAMTEVFTAKGVNIQNVQARTGRDRRAISTFDVLVRDTTQLSELIRDLQKLEYVIAVQRTNFGAD